MKNAFLKITALILICAVMFTLLASCKQDDPPSNDPPSNDPPSDPIVDDPPAPDPSDDSEAEGNGRGNLLGFLKPPYSEAHKYIEIARESYLNFDAVIKRDPVDEKAIESAFIKALYPYRTADATLGTASYSATAGLPRAIGIGDSVTLKYVGYTISEDGVKSYFAGGNNVSASAGYTLGIGSGSFIGGFECGLVGKMPVAYSASTALPSVVVSERDAVVVSMTVAYEDGTSSTGRFTIVANPEVSDLSYGEGFSEFLIGRSIGHQTGESFSSVISSGSVTYSDVSIEAIYSPINVATYFPIGYSQAALAGMVAYFDVYVESVQYYTVPEFDESFVTDRLGMTVEALRAFGEAGESLADCYRAYLKDKLESERAAVADHEIMDVFFEVFPKLATIKQLPTEAIEEYYQDSVDEIYGYYESYQYYYSSVDELACYMLGLASGSDWRASLREYSEAVVIDRLVFYYVLADEALAPTEAELTAAFNEIFAEMLSYALEQLDIHEYDYATKEAYQARVNEVKELLLDEDEGYGYDYFAENAYYVCGVKKITSLAVVVT